MSINESKLRSPAQWRKWKKSGALLPGFVIRERVGKLTIWKPTRSFLGRELTASIERCGLRGMTLSEMEALLKEWAPPVTRVRPSIGTPKFHVGSLGTLSWHAGQWHNTWGENYGFVAVSRD